MICCIFGHDPSSSEEHEPLEEEIHYVDDFGGRKLRRDLVRKRSCLRCGVVYFERHQPSPEIRKHIDGLRRTIDRLNDEYSRLREEFLAQSSGRLRQGPLNSPTKDNKDEVDLL